jgi:hypothetical protein
MYRIDFRRALNRSEPPVLILSEPDTDKNRSLYQSKAAVRSETDICPLRMGVVVFCRIATVYSHCVCFLEPLSSSQGLTSLPTVVTPEGCPSSGTLSFRERVKTSLFELFKIGIGPSSSHKGGADGSDRKFVLDLESRDLLLKANLLRVDPYGSLAHTGKRHGTDTTILMGLYGEEPQTIDPSRSNLSSHSSFRSPAPAGEANDSLLRLG